MVSTTTHCTTNCERTSTRNPSPFAIQLKKGTHITYISTYLVWFPLGVALLCKFHACIEALPHDVGDADEFHPLAQFAGDPMGCVEENEDAWEKFDGPPNTLLQKPQDELRHLVQVGENGLIGLCRFLEYLVTYHQVTGHLFEGKLERLMHAIDEV